MKKLAIILLLISLALLIVYGLDTYVAFMKLKTTGNESAGGFLPISEAIRGGVFGGGAVALSVIGFAIGRTDASVAIPALLFINGGLIIIGMILVIGLMNQDFVNGVDLRTMGSTMIFGGLLIALGIVKIILNRRKTVTS